MGKVKFATLHAGLLLRERGPNLDDDEDDINQPDGHLGGDPSPLSTAPTEVPPVEADIETEADNAAPPASVAPPTVTTDAPALETAAPESPSTATPSHPPTPSAAPLRPLSPAANQDGPAEADPADPAPSAERPPAAQSRGPAGRKVPAIAYGKIFGRRNRPPSAESAASTASAPEPPTPQAEVAETTPLETPAAETSMPTPVSKVSPPPEVSTEQPAVKAPTLSLAGAREAVAAQILKRRPRRSKSRRRAMTLRLDPDRHHRLRDISDRLHRSCQSILTEALDDFITVHANDPPYKKS